MAFPIPQDPNKSIRDTFKQTKILNRQQAEPIAPAKREFTIEIITELITPVVVWATTQEEAEHLALEQFKLAAGDGQREVSESLARLWSVIGDGGCRLTSAEKVQMVQALSEASYWSPKYSYTLAHIFGDFAEENNDFELQDFAKCTPRILWRNIDTVFGFTLSAKECWDAIKEIALMESASATNSNSLLSPALEEEIAAIQKIFAEAEGNER